MTKRFLAAALFLSILALYVAPARAQSPMNRDFGLGLVLGDPFAITGKVWFDNKNALDFGIGYDYSWHQGVAVYVDYIWNLHNFLQGKGKPFDLIFSIGVGGKVGAWHQHDHHWDDAGFGMGVRAPFGLAMEFKRHPFEVFFELAPVLMFGSFDNHVWGDIDAGVGARFYFP